MILIYYDFINYNCNILVYLKQELRYVSIC